MHLEDDLGDAVGRCCADGGTLTAGAGERAHRSCRGPRHPCSGEPRCAAGNGTGAVQTWARSRGLALKYTRPDEPYPSIWPLNRYLVEVAGRAPNRPSARAENRPNPRRLGVVDGLDELGALQVVVDEG